MLNISAHFDEHDGEIDVRLDIWVMERILKWVDILKERHGADRSVGPVTFRIRTGEPYEIHIETQKQGTYIWRYNSESYEWVQIEGFLPALA